MFFFHSSAKILISFLSKIVFSFHFSFSNCFFFCKLSFFVVVFLFFQNCFSCFPSQSAFFSNFHNCFFSQTCFFCPCQNYQLFLHFLSFRSQNHKFFRVFPFPSKRSSSRSISPGFPSFFANLLSSLSKYCLKFLSHGLSLFLCPKPSFSCLLHTHTHTFLLSNSS